MWSAIKYNSYNSTTQNVFALDGTNRKRIEGSNVYEWGIAAPTAKPTIAAGASTGLTGDYNAKYTYCRKEGTTVVAESDPSPAADAAATLSNESFSVTWTASSDSQVTHVRVYRTLTDGAIYYHDQDIATGTVTVDSTTADGSLGSEVATDHDRPPLGSFVFGPAYDGTCFICKDNLLHYCKPKQPEYWPLLYYIEVGQVQFPLQCGVFHNGQPYALSKVKIFYIQGTGNNTFFPLPMESITGAQGPKGALSVHGHGIFHVGTDGLYLYSSKDENITQDAFRPIFRGERVNGVPGAVHLENAWLIQFRNQIYFGYPGSRDDFSYCHDWESDYLTGTGFKFTTTVDSDLGQVGCFTWEADTTEDLNDFVSRRTDGDDYPSNILVMNLDNKRTSYFHYGPEFRSVAVDDANDRLIAADGNGFVWQLEDNTKTDDEDIAIAWEVQSKDFTLQTRRHFPRWIKYDVDASDADTCTGALVMDGTDHQSHTITGERVTKRRLVETGNGRRLSIKISGTGPVEIFAAEGE